MKQKKNRNRILSATVFSLMILGIGSSVIAAPLSKLPSILDNSLVIGKHLFELDKVNSSQYNLNKFVEAAKTVDEDNKVYYKYNGKWYTGNDIESLTNLKNAKGLDNITNDIIKVNGQGVNYEDPIKPSDAKNDKPKVEPKEQNKQDKNNIYNDGEYIGYDIGLGYPVKIRVTIKNDKILKIDVLENKDTPTYFEKARVLIDKIIGIQSVNVEKITGATYSSRGIKGAVKNALEKAKIKKRDSEDTIKIVKNENLYNNGLYEGEASGLSATTKVKVAIEDNKIKKVDVLESNETPSFLEMGKQIIDKILEKQSIKVDKISGATYSSSGIKHAVNNALEKARINKENKHAITVNNYIAKAEENKIEFDKIPSKVITTNQTMVELMIKLGLEDKIIGTTETCYPILPSLKDKYDKIPKINKDEIIKNKPELILGYGDERYDKNLGDIKQLNEQGIQVYVPRNTVWNDMQKVSVENIYKDIEDIGALFNVEDKAKKLIESMKESTNSVQEKLKEVNGKNIKVLPIEISDYNSYIPCLKGTIFTRAIDMAGGQCEYNDGKILDDYVVKYINPDVIVIIYDGNGEEIKSFRNNFKELNAVKNNRIIVVSEAETLLGGIRTSKLIETLAKNFYPKTFNYTIEKHIESEKTNKQSSKVYKDGTYEGKGNGYKSIVNVRVTTKEDKIVSIQPYNIKEVSWQMDMVMGMIPQIIKKQSTEVPNIEDALYTSKGFKDAVNDALEKAKNALNGDTTTEKKNEEKVIPCESDTVIRNFSQDGGINQLIFKKVPEKVVTVGKDATELLLKLGLEDKIAGVCNVQGNISPDLKDKYEKLNKLSEKYPNIKDIENKNIDLIIGQEKTFFSDALGFTESWIKKGTNTFIFADSFEDNGEQHGISKICSDIEKIGMIFKVSDKRNILLKSINDSLKKIDDSIKNSKQKQANILSLTNCYEECYSLNKDTLVADIIKRLGSMTNPYMDQYDVDKIIDENPDVIIIVENDEEKSSLEKMRDILKDSKLKDVNAIKNNKVLVLSKNDVYPGGIGIVDVVEKIARVCYPELFIK